MPDDRSVARINKGVPLPCALDCMTQKRIIERSSGYKVHVIRKQSLHYMYVCDVHT